MNVVRSAKEKTIMVMNPNELNHLSHVRVRTVLHPLDKILITRALWISTAA